MKKSLTALLALFLVFGTAATANAFDLFGKHEIRVKAGGGNVGCVSYNGERNCVNEKGNERNRTNRYSDSRSSIGYYDQAERNVERSARQVERNSRYADNRAEEYDNPSSVGYYDRRDRAAKQNNKNSRANNRSHHDEVYRADDLRRNGNGWKVR